MQRGSELEKLYEEIERKYRSDQARVPAGSREGGQWTDEGGGGASNRGGIGNSSRYRLSQLRLQCESLYNNDVAICRRVRSGACYAQAMLRFSNCLVGRPIPPLNY